ncbi:hypothetical protein F2P44_28685 [Massilia sp. CCM 8695]|uniref:Uncharacterized protein n=1 Tax=Massilia frigida TaxID=2609281 RepID=A0ABX0NCP6_9BURK|nr:hypothetical protein [Massilia frigida]
MAAPQLTLWEAVVALAVRVPFARAHVERVLGATLRATGRGGNELFYLYESTPVPLAGGVVIANVDLRIAREGSHPGFMVLDIGGSCVSLADVRRQYGTLRLTGYPRGRSFHETTSHTSQRSWGTLSFGFAERNPDCLSSIAFDPAKAPPP